jgi:hypothetical protein
MAARVCGQRGLGFALPDEENEPLLDNSGQVLETEKQEAVAA